MQSGGALMMSSQPGLGTKVELWLPRTTEGCKVAGEPPAVIGASARRLRILLVDDDPLVVASTADMLEDLGHGSLCVASAEEALAALAREPFDLLLSDVMMPGMNGVALAKAARALHAELPILLASGFAELDGLAGTDWPRLRKPYDLKDLAAALAAVVVGW
jgi:CheY-like chemotaxis protein